jgi:DNA-directed RNA polymerase specialized sigma24 family protein
MRADHPGVNTQQNSSLPDLVSDLASCDDEALTGLLRSLIPIALAQLQERFGLRRLRVRDELEAQAALFSAWSSFRRHCHEGKIKEAESPEELAGQLVRIACNRAQRRRRQDEKLSAAVRRGTTRDENGQRVSVDFVDSAPGPDQEALKNELVAYIRDAIDSIKEQLRGKPRGLETIQVYLEDMEQLQKDIASKVKINQATVSRRIEWFRDRIRQMVEEDGMA